MAVPLAGARTLPTSGRVGRACHRGRGRLARAVPHGSAGAQEGPCAGQEARTKRQFSLTEILPNLLHTQITQAKKIVSPKGHLRATVNT